MRRIEYWITPKSDASTCWAAASGVADGCHMSMSEWTAVAPEVSRRLAMRTRFATASPGQSAARSMLPNARIAGPM